MATKTDSKSAKTAEASLREMDSVARTVAKQLPGWRLAREPLEADDTYRRTVVEVSRGVNIRELRQKFLRADEAADSADAGEAFAAPETETTVVLVEPIKGGDAKLADLAGGKVKLVQG